MASAIASSSPPLTFASKSDVNGRPTTAASDATSRVALLSCENRVRMTACTLGGSPSSSPPFRPARTSSTMKSGLPLLFIERSRGGLGRSVGDLRRERSRVVGRERAKRDFGAALVATQVAQHSGDGVLDADIARARGGEHHQAGVRVEAKQVLEPFDRLRVAPLHVVDEGEQRL